MYCTLDVPSAEECEDLGRLRNYEGVNTSQISAYLGLKETYIDDNMAWDVLHIFVLARASADLKSSEIWRLVDGYHRVNSTYPLTICGNRMVKRPGSRMRCHSPRQSTEMAYQSRYEPWRTDYRFSRQRRARWACSASSKKSHQLMTTNKHRVVLT